VKKLRSPNPLIFKIKNIDIYILYSEKVEIPKPIDLKNKEY
jgi:hypothetical protein